MTVLPTSMPKVPEKEQLIPPSPVSPSCLEVLRHANEQDNLLGIFCRVLVGLTLMYLLGNISMYFVFDQTPWQGNVGMIIFSILWGVGTFVVLSTGVVVVVGCFICIYDYFARTRDDLIHSRTVSAVTPGEAV